MNDDNMSMSGAFSEIFKFLKFENSEDRLKFKKELLEEEEYEISDIYDLLVNENINQLENPGARELLKYVNIEKLNSIARKYTMLQLSLVWRRVVGRVGFCHEFFDPYINSQIEKFPKIFGVFYAKKECEILHYDSKNFEWKVYFSCTENNNPGVRIYCNNIKALVMEGDGHTNTEYFLEINLLGAIFYNSSFYTIGEDGSIFNSKFKRLFIAKSTEFRDIFECLNAEPNFEN
jgi:hypothetical protein